MIMKKLNSSGLIIGLVMVVLGTVPAKSAQYTINNVGTTFSPNTLSIKVGDTVNFVLASNHNALEVSQATYDANGNTSNGGFSVPFGGGTVVFHNAGTYYFVCQPHAALGMKGIITVSAATGVTDIHGVSPDLQIYPNPVTDYVKVAYVLNHNAKVTITLSDMSGREVAGLLSDFRGTGKWEETFNLGSLTPGLYLLMVRKDNETVKQKLIIR
jgi:Plastocyanin